MKNAFVNVTIILTLAHCALAYKCPTIPKYEKAIKEKSLCKGNDVNYLWPNYKNVQQYYRCQGEDNPILEQCPPSYSLFDFVQQKCSRCERYIPSPDCEEIIKVTSKIECESFTTTVEENPEECDINLSGYTKQFRPTCIGNDIYMYWPNYKNPSFYYWCKGPNNPQMAKCSVPEYFNFYTQSCVHCSSYIPPPPCDTLNFDKSNKCVGINEVFPPLLEFQPVLENCLDLMKGYNKKLNPTCNNPDVLWPVYDNFKQYYLCLGAGNPHKVSCPPDSYFSYPLQKCTRCDRFQPPPVCDDLPEGSGDCVTFDSSLPPTISPEVCEKANFTGVYKKKLNITCVGTQVYRLWPDYTDAKKYIICDGYNNTKTLICPSNTFFNFYQQECTSCYKFVAPPDCNNLLPKDATNLKCVNI